MGGKSDHNSPREKRLLCWQRSKEKSLKKEEAESLNTWKVKETGGRDTKGLVN